MFPPAFQSPIVAAFCTCRLLKPAGSLLHLEISTIAHVTEKPRCVSVCVCMCCTKCVKVKWGFLQRVNA